MSFLFYASLVSLIFVAVIMILLILIQKGRGGGLSSAFGGSGGTSAFGAKTGDVLTWATSSIFALFIVLAVVLDLVVSSQYPSVSSTAVASSGGAGSSATLPPLPEAPPPVSFPVMPTAPATQPISGSTGRVTNPLQPAASIQSALQKLKSTTMP